MSNKQFLEMVTKYYKEDFSDFPKDVYEYILGEYQDFHSYDFSDNIITIVGNSNHKLKIYFERDLHQSYKDIIDNSSRYFYNVNIRFISIYPDLFNNGQDVREWVRYNDSFKIDSYNIGNYIKFQEELSSKLHMLKNME